MVSPSLWPLLLQEMGACTLGLPHAGAPQTCRRPLPSARSGRRAALCWGDPDLPGKPVPARDSAPPQRPLLLPGPHGMLGGLLGALPPQLHKHLGLAVTLPALQKLQDWVPCEESRLGVRFRGTGRGR